MSFKPFHQKRLFEILHLTEVKSVYKTNISFTGPMSRMPQDVVLQGGHQEAPVVPPTWNWLALRMSLLLQTFPSQRRSSKTFFHFPTQRRSEDSATRKSGMASAVESVLRHSGLGAAFKEKDSVKKSAFASESAGWWRYHSITVIQELLDFRRQAWIPLDFRNPDFYLYDVLMVDIRKLIQN